MTPTEPPDEQLGQALSLRRPAPSNEFADHLRTRLMLLHWTAQRPAHLRLLIAAWTCCGLLLLALAALGAAGSGLFS
jgi:hypothetical protein